MSTSPTFIEESFGILTDDDLYLDCVLVRPADLTDGALRALRVWVPKYPLTKESVLTCARQEVRPYGRQGHVAHLVFDLRGTGNSDRKNEDFETDLAAIRAWAEERFSQRPLSINFFGFPESRATRVSLLPLRKGVVAETYYYPASGLPTGGRPPVLYLATYGNFTPDDETMCLALAEAGYDVYGMDPLRYLLHASAHGRLQVVDLYRDIAALSQMLPGPPMLVGQPIAAGLALMWATREESARGVIAVGEAQLGFKPRHIFANSNLHTFFLGRYVDKITPWAAVLVQVNGHPLGGSADELGSLHQTCSNPRRLEFVKGVTPALLLEWLHWLQKTGR